MFACAGMRACPYCPLLNSVRGQERLRSMAIADTALWLQALTRTVRTLQSLRLITPWDHKTRCDNTERDSASGAGILIDIKATDPSMRRWLRRTDERRGRNTDGGLRKQCKVLPFSKRCHHGTFEEHRKMTTDLSPVQDPRGAEHQSSQTCFL